MTEQPQRQTDFSATDSALGYIYQIRLALVSSLQRLKRGETFSTYLETLDDVVFEPVDSAPDLVQLKHHNDKAVNLTDANPDLWKSLRVWIEGRTDGNIPTDARLYLITTSSIGQNSSASHLTPNERNELEAVKRLQATASTSTNKTNTSAYTLFRNLSQSDKLALVSSITILSEAPNISNIESNLRTEAQILVRRNHLNYFVRQLEGWWYRRVVKQLIDPDTPPILSNELESEIQDLRDRFGPEDLPVDEDILFENIERDAYEHRIFFQQAKLAGIGGRRIFKAVKDYYRAYTQRSRWIREELLHVGELDKYELLLREEWELQFERIADEIGEDAAEEARQRTAKKIYAWVEDTIFPIRPGVGHPSISRGSFHMLSDDLKIGWHPDFIERLQHLLEPQGIT